MLLLFFFNLKGLLQQQKKFVLLQDLRFTTRKLRIFFTLKMIRKQSIFLGLADKQRPKSCFYSLAGKTTKVSSRLKSFPDQKISRFIAFLEKSMLILSFFLKKGKRKFSFALQKILLLYRSFEYRGSLSIPDLCLKIIKELELLREKRYHDLVVALLLVKMSFIRFIQAKN